MDKNIKKTILVKYRNNSISYALLTTLMPLSAFTLALYLSFQFSIINSIWLVPLIGWIYYRLYFPLHDLSHLNLFKSKSTNYFFGYIISGLFAIPFLNFRDEHLSHHKHHGSEDDPAKDDYQVKINTKKDLMLFLLSPLIGLSTFKKIKENYLNKERKKIKTSDNIGIITVLIIQVTLICLFLYFKNYGILHYFIFIVLPGTTFFLFFSRLRQFLEHYPNLSDDERNIDFVSRSFNLNFFENLIFSSASFKYHHEHHLFPSIPSVHLEKIYNELDPMKDYSGKSKINYVSTMKKVWDNL